MIKERVFLVCEYCKKEMDKIFLERESLEKKEGAIIIKSGYVIIDGIIVGLDGFYCDIECLKSEINRGIEIRKNIREVINEKRKEIREKSRKNN